MGLVGFMIINNIMGWLYLIYIFNGMMFIVGSSSSGLRFLSEEGAKLVCVFKTELYLTNLSFLQIHFRHEVLPQVALDGLNGRRYQTRMINIPPIPDRHLLNKKEHT